MGGFKTNELYHQKQLANADFTAVVRPNVDTYVASVGHILPILSLLVSTPKPWWIFLRMT